MTVRTTKDAPWCWQSKETLRRISDGCDRRTDRALVLAVYLALTWIGSDEGDEVFTAPKTRIAERAGVSYRKAADVLTFLERLGVINVAENIIEGTHERGPNTYTLGTACATSGTACLTPSTECLRLGTDAEQWAVPRLEKKGKENKETGASRFVPPTPEEVTAYSSEIGYPLNGAAWCDSYAQKGWAVGKSKMKDWHAAVRNWKANGWQPNDAPAGGAARREAPVRNVSAA